MTEAPIRLTQTVQKGGCAAKIAAQELREILSQVQFPPRGKQVLVDGDTFDDAGVFQINDDLALVQTLDFFTPIVDTPQTFGRVAAANALSDVYAMGGEPQTAMAILAFPVGGLPQAVIAQVMQGACDILKEASVSLLGGHSIDDDTLKFGLSVTGSVHPQKIWTNARARVGDQLILTKALGTGTAMAALKRGACLESELTEALGSMCLLNRVKDLLSTPGQLDAIHAATDITGFGLLGHSLQMAKASGVDLVFTGAQIPLLPKTREFLKQEFLTKAHRTNWNYVEKNCDFSSADSILRLALVDPQTSGGLLLSVSSDQAESIVQSLQSRFSAAAIVGQVQLKQRPQAASFVRVT